MATWQVGMARRDQSGVCSGEFHLPPKAIAVGWPKQRRLQ
jgi:hypothetical protein